MPPALDVIIVSLFCAGGLFAYLREVFRLRRIISCGKPAVARIESTKAEDAGSDTVTHYLVKYEFVDADGNLKVHEEDLNNRRFFDTLKQGDTIDILYEPVADGSSYPVSQVTRDLMISKMIVIGIVIVWVVMTALFTLT